MRGLSVGNFLRKAFLFGLGCTLASGLAARNIVQAQNAVKIDPENPKYLLFRGKPLVLISATEHYGSVVNRPFNFERYLDDAAAHKMTMTRTFLFYRELQDPRNPSSPIKPESPDFISPFVRSGPGKALDGEPIYDLDQWNQEYFDRLHRFLDAASRKGIVVELTVFSNTYGPVEWSLNPLRAANNKQHIGDVDWEEYTSLKNPELLHRQEAFARKIVEETSSYDNVYYEICNEPAGGIPGHATPADVDAWQKDIARVMRDEMRRLGHLHLLSGAWAWRYDKAAPSGVDVSMDASFAGTTFDIVNNHPLPSTHFNGRTYDMGDYQSKELRLNQLAAFCKDTYSFPKPTVLDEDNTASMYRDAVGWTIHRKRAWTALFSGCHYDYIDFSITVGSESGTAASQLGIRTWMQYLSEFMTSFDFVHSKPDISWIASYPAHLHVSGLVYLGRDYVAYLADSRELTDPTAGGEIGGSISFSLPPGSYDVSLYSPITGESSPAIQLSGGASTLTLRPFRQDIVVWATRRDDHRL